MKRIILSLLMCLIPSLMVDAQSISSDDIQGVWIISGVYDSVTDEIIYVPSDKDMGWAFTDIKIGGMPVSILSVNGATTRFAYEIKGRKIYLYADYEKEESLALMEILEINPKKKMIVRMFLDFDDDNSYKAILSFVGD